LKSLLDQQHVLIDDVTTYSQRVEQLPEQLATVVQQRDVLRDLAVRAPDLQLRLSAAQERLLAWEQREVLDARVRACETEVRTVVDQSQNARDAVHVATERRLAGMAAELAGSLAAGDACAVCGSTEHPQLAQAVDVPVSQEQLDELTRVFDHLAERRRDLESVLSSAVAERERNQALAGDVDPAEEIAELDELVKQASQAELDLPDCAAQADLLQRELDESRTGLTNSQAQVVGLDEQIAVHVAQVAESTSLIELKRGTYASIAERIEALTNYVGTTSEWARATSEAENLQQHLLAISQAIDAAAREAGCEDTADALAGLRSDERLTALTSEIADHERAVAINAAALAESEDVELPEITPDLDVANEQLNMANRAAELARINATSAQITVNEVARCVAAIAAASAAIAEVTARTAPTIRVADALTGQGRVNPRRMTLSTYVLRERFASVVEAASRRLDRMSDGRYVLERDEAVSGNRKAGLGLLVLDQWTGARRDTRTLSGGESFYASLSLALGLADVVRDETGGVELETLFIDEGFGSLDPESLESVLSVIDSLRDGGRVVGIVSHVSELKERIPDRIEIRRRPDGSSTVSVRAS
jgi:exonuclease SbcC